MENLQIKIKDYRLHEGGAGDGWLVTFLITNTKNLSYCAFESLVTLKDSLNKTEEEIIDLAYEKIEHEIKDWYNSPVAQRSAVIDKIYTPSKR